MSQQRVVQRATLSSDSSTSTSSTSTLSNVHKPSSTPVIAGTLAGCIVVIACVLTFILIRKRRRRLRAEYAAHFAAAAERANFPREHPDKGKTLGKYTTQELPPRSHDSSASSSGSSPALPPAHNPSPLQQSHRHDPISNRDNGSHDYELQSRRSRRRGSDRSPGSSLPPVYQNTITASRQQRQRQQPPTNPNSTVRPFPATLPAGRSLSDLAGRPHGRTDAVADLGSPEDDNNSNNNSYNPHNIPGAHNGAISGSIRHHSDVGGLRRGDLSEGLSGGGGVGGPNAGVSPAIAVPQGEIMGERQGYRNEAPPSPLNSGGGLGEGAGRRLSPLAPSAEISRHAGERDYLEGGRQWQGTTTPGTSTPVSGSEYPYPGSGAGSPLPNEDVSSSPSVPRRSGGGGSTIISPPISSTTPVSSHSLSRDAPQQQQQQQQQHYYTTALPPLPPPPHTSFSPTSRTHVHISDGAGGTPIQEEEDAPPAYENIWPSAREEDRRRAELHQLQQARE